jgi:thioesterase domain-containing protein
MLQLMELLQPGCEGVISNYKTIPRSHIRKGYEFISNMAPEMPEDELYDPLDEFGWQEMNPDLDHAEGGGDHHRDEL